MATRKKTGMLSEDVFFTRLFSCVAQEGWATLTLPKIAKATKTPLNVLLQSYPDKEAMLKDFAQFIDGRVAASAPEEEAPLKDRLFELMMLRLDQLQPYRSGLIRLINDLQSHPLSALFLGAESFCTTRRSAQLMLELAGVPRTYAFFMLLCTGYELAYLQTLRTWKNDESVDLSATMAIIDRALERLLRLARLL